MSDKQLRKAARLKVPQQMPDFATKITMMLMADRTDESGAFEITAEDDFYGELAEECNAVMDRLRGDHFLRPGVDHSRVSRVIEALKEAEDE